MFIDIKEKARDFLAFLLVLTLTCSLGLGSLTQAYADDDVNELEPSQVESPAQDSSVGDKSANLSSTEDATSVPEQAIDGANSIDSSGSSEAPKAPEEVVPAAELDLETQANDPAAESRAKAYKTPLAEGIYSIATSANPGIVLAVKGSSAKDGANIELDNFSPYKNNQYFSVSVDSKGLYSFKAVNSGKLLSSAPNPKAAYNVFQWIDVKTAAQKWIVHKIDGRKYLIESFANRGIFLNVANAKYSSGTNVDLWVKNGTGAQNFTFAYKDEKYYGPSTVDIEQGTYNISTPDKSMALSVENPNLFDRQPIVLTTNTNHLSQQVNIYKDGKGYYRLSFACSGKALSAQSNGRRVGATVFQEQVQFGSNSQSFSIHESPSGGYMFISKAGLKQVYLP